MLTATPVIAALAVTLISAQQVSDSGIANNARLSVRPRTMATATRTVQSGLQRLASLRDYLVYVPPNCVGARRVPLVVFLSGAGVSSMQLFDKERELADKYGMIMLLPSADSAPGVWDALLYVWSGKIKVVPGTWLMTVPQFINTDVRNIDTAMKQVLGKFAIDPDKIAIAGFSNGGTYSLFLGSSNMDIFSRVAPMSAVSQLYGPGPQIKETQFFVSGGVAEHLLQPMVELTQYLRERGHAVTSVIGLRAHVDYKEEDDYMWSWLANSWSWKALGGVVQPPPRAAADSDPVLTLDALSKMTAFWHAFMKEPASVRMFGRKANQEVVKMFLGQVSVSVVKVNMIAMASRYPSVTSDLQAAGLTAQQEEAYREAIIRVGFTREAVNDKTLTAYATAKLAKQAVGTIAETSALGKNMAFRAAHEQEFKALSQTGMWVTP